MSKLDRDCLYNHAGQRAHSEQLSVGVGVSEVLDDGGEETRDTSQPEVHWVAGVDIRSCQRGHCNKGKTSRTGVDSLHEYITETT